MERHLHREDNTYSQLFPAQSQQSPSEPSTGLFLDPTLVRSSDSTPRSYLGTQVDGQRDDPWRGKTILALDGGGVRGYSSLLILRALMREIKRLEEHEIAAPCSAHPLQQRSRKRRFDAPEAIPTTALVWRNTTPVAPVFQKDESLTPYLPSHYFDYIAGTSTGGLIAIMLGRLGMTVDDCLEAYGSLAGQVFGKPRLFHVRRPYFGIFQDKYDHIPLQNAIKEIVRKYDHTGSTTAPFRQPHKDMCRTIVTAWKIFRDKAKDVNRELYLFRSYHHPQNTQIDLLERNPGREENSPIWLIGRATSAAPTYFQGIELDDDPDDAEFIDGAFGANNPAEEAYHSIKQYWNYDATAIQFLMSIGTGKNKRTGRRARAGFSRYLDFFNDAAKLATQSEETHLRIQRTMEENRTPYARLNVEEGIGKMRLDEWKGKSGHKTIDTITTETNAYLATAEARALIASSGRRLVDIRRARATTNHLDEWERFCYGVSYECPFAGCRVGRETFNKRQYLRDHLMEAHPLAPNTIESKLDEGKRFRYFEHGE